MRSRNFSLRPPFLWLISLLLPVLPSSAEIKTPGRIPLQPIPAKVQVERGKKVAIPLRVYGGGHKSVTYRVRSAPRFGTLIDSRMIDENDGLVTYQHSGEFGHDTDIFYFAAKSIEGVSAQVAVEIAVTDRQPKMVAPTHMEFGEVLIGAGAVNHVSIKNAGGGISHGVATATAPWQVAGDPTYSIGPGESSMLTVFCRPVTEGELHGTLKFSSSPASSMMLHATAFPPFRIEPGKLDLTFDRESGNRSGTLRIENSAGLDQTIRISGGDSLTLPKKLPLPANAHAAIRVDAEPGNLSAIDAIISITGTNYGARIPVTAATVPAIVEVNKSVVDFGEVPLRQTAESSLFISNRGGEKAFLDLAVTPPFSLTEGSVNLSLEPGEFRKIGITIRPESFGRTSGEIIVKGFQTEFPVRLVARTPRPAFGNRPPDARKTPDTRQWPGLAGAFPLLENTRLESVTNTTVTIAWPTSADAEAIYRLEARILSVGKGAEKVEVRWIPFSNVSFDQSGGETRATAADLTSGGGYNVRVVEVDPLGHILRASRTLQAIPSPAKRFALAPIHGLVALLAIVSVLLARQKAQKRREACRHLVGATRRESCTI